MLCPICASIIAPDQAACPNCKTSVAEYRQVYYAPDILFNEGIDYINRKQYVDACDKLCAAANLKKDDVQILRVWAFAAEQTEDLPLALTVLAKIMAATEDPEIGKHFDALSKELEKESVPVETLLMEMMCVQCGAMEQMAAGMRGLAAKYGGRDATTGENLR
jgi:hypothetical protein